MMKINTARYVRSETNSISVLRSARNDFYKMKLHFLNCLPCNRKFKLQIAALTSD